MWAVWMLIGFIVGELVTGWVIAKGYRQGRGR
jgi:hypothetical protein